MNATHSAGAEIVIGFEKSVWNIEVNDWCKAFFIAIADGKTVTEACIEADAYIANYWYDPTHPEYDIRTNTWYIAGNGNTTFS